jgi:hypothetical protein
MNVFNRTVVILLLVVIIVLAAVFVIVPRDSLRLVALTAEWLYDGAVDYANADPLFFAALRVIIGGAGIILCLFIMWLELRRPRKKTIRAQKLEGGEAFITTDSVEQRLAYNIDQLPEVIRVFPQVTSRTRGVDLSLLVETTPEIDVPMKTEEIMQVAREVIVERMGLKLGKVQVKIKHAPYPKE